MNKMKLLPRLAVMNIRKSSSTYLPYMGISIFAVFTYFIFDLILNNEVIRTVPRATYVYVLMSTGFVLLGLIMIPFLYYTNSFLIKRRKREIGLYSILGLEKKHIGIMMFFETLIIYIVVTLAGILLGLLFAKLLFLLLLNLTGLSVETTFTFSPIALRDTLLFYGFLSLLNLAANLIEVGKANPIELMSETKKGEKDIKFIGLWTVLGVVCLAGGYYTALTSQLDSAIFLNFFSAVLLVVMGTYFLFTSGSVSMLKGMKKNKKFYYKQANFITISGMLYRMKKNAASLVNICIFATMSIITVVCTIAVYFGTAGINNYQYPNDVEINFMSNEFENKDSFQKAVQTSAEEAQITIRDFLAYEYVQINVSRDGNKVIPQIAGEYINWFRLRLMTVSEFNQMENTSYELAAGEVIIYGTGPDFDSDSIIFGDMELMIQKELKECRIDPKEADNTFEANYLVVVPDYETISQIAAVYGVSTESSMGYKIALKLDGSWEEKSAYAMTVQNLAGSEKGFASFQYFEESRKENEVMYGGLLFIGIIFGMTFLLCLLIIMYYKQISEGFEDQQGFDIMQKVGLSDGEVKNTIRKQILIMFFMPLVGAILHAIIGLNMVAKLLAAVNFYQSELLIVVTIGIFLIFAAVYCFCYNRTARTYYRIVRKMVA